MQAESLRGAAIESFQEHRIWKLPRATGDAGPASGEQRLLRRTESEADPDKRGPASAVIVARRMEHIEDGACCKGARGMALMWCDVKHLTWSQNVRDAGDRQREGATK